MDLNPLESDITLKYMTCCCPDTRHIKILHIKHKQLNKTLYSDNAVPISNTDIVRVIHLEPANPNTHIKKHCKSSWWSNVQLKSNLDDV